MGGQLYEAPHDLKGGGNDSGRLSCPQGECLRGTWAVAGSDCDLISL